MDLDQCLDDCFLPCVIVLAIIFPPMGVLAMYGCRLNFFINLLLTLLFYIPGLVHAIVVIMEKYHQQQQQSLLSVISMDSC